MAETAEAANGIEASKPTSPETQKIDNNPSGILAILQAAR
jgi:hypothetical protein